MFAARFALVLLTIFTLEEGNASTRPAGTITNVEQSVGSLGRVDWSVGVLTAVGIGTPPAQPANVAQTRSMTERAAQVVAYRNLLDVVKAVQVDSTTTVEHSIVTSDAIRTEVSGIIQGATIMDKQYMTDGFVKVTVGMKLAGALAEALLPTTTHTPPTGLSGALVPAAEGRLYTGLIVDARGLGLKQAMAPKILNEDGKEVYGSAWARRDFAVREGMAHYLKDPVRAQLSPRVADKPLMIKAIKVAGDAAVDMVITNEDAVMLLSASENLNILQKCRVIVLVD